MNPNLHRLPVKPVIIICLFYCCSAGRSHRHCTGKTRPTLSAIICGDATGTMPLDSNPYPFIGAIPPPAGYHRVPASPDSFAGWLRAIRLKKNRTVYLYNGTPKFNQEAQFAVLDVSVGNVDLQQCADAIMRLRAEFLYSHKDFKNIEFRTAQGTRLNFLEWAGGKRWQEKGGRLVSYQAPPCEDRKCFQDYLQIVFTYCGTLSLERQLVSLDRSHEMQIGDVLIHGGSPGHAMLVVDMAGDSAGSKVYMLTQGYMPAQDIHIVKNGNDTGLSPWYQTASDKPVYTPEYSFYPGQWRTWPR